MKDEAKTPNVGEGPYSIGQDAGGMWRVIVDGKPTDNFYVAAKTAARRARELNADTSALPAIVRELDDANKEADAEIEAADAEPLILEGSPSALRHAWLEKAAAWSKQWLKDHGTDVPDKVRVSIGTMYASKKAIGQCWHEEASEDGHREVFISPTLGDGAVIVATLVHELIHAALPSDAKHGPLFKQHAHAAGLAGKMKATIAGDELATAIGVFMTDVSAYPAARLNPALSGIKKQGTRLLKCECAVCGYTLRLTAKWVNQSGAPLCPTDWEEGEEPPHGRMSVSEPEGGE